MRDMVDVKKQDFRNILGEELQAALSESKEAFKAGRLAESLVFIDWFISMIPEKSPAAIDLTGRLDQITSWYKDELRNLEIEEKSIGILEQLDLGKKRSWTDVSFVSKKIKACNNLFLKHKLYENTSQVDYEI
jgi:hypothetical protein